MTGSAPKIWPYQSHYLLSALNAARDVFGALDEQLAPQVGLLAIACNEQTGPGVLFDPEGFGYEPDEFKDLCQIAQKVAADAEQNYLVFIDVDAPHDYEHHLHAHAVRTAVQDILNRKDASGDFVSFVSWPARLNEFLVAVILRLARRPFESHYALTRDRAFERYPIATSLITAATAEFLDGCGRALAGPSPGAQHSILGREADEVIRAAGKRLMRTPLWATSGHDVGNLYDAINTISSLTYEGEETTGLTILARRGHPNAVLDLTLRRAIELREFRAIRKLIEIASDDLALISDGAQVYGFGRMSGAYDAAREDLFTINFLGYYNWELRHGGHVLMRVTYGQPHLPHFPVQEQKFKSDLRRIFAEIQPPALERLWRLVRRAGRQQRGTMVVISVGAAQEAERLEAQCIRVDPLRVDDRLVELVTAIDGAVLVDVDGMCHAIGVILDGLASRKGTPARGARYNSAVRYVEHTPYPCLAVVISEEGSIDLLPELPPPVSPEDVEAVLHTLRDLGRSDRPEPRTFQRCMEWFSENRNSLSVEQCREINTLKAEIGRRIRERATSVVHFMTWDDFEPCEPAPPREPAHATD
ncbi:MAG TPA: diadenylate cyclase [Phycisphaerae bacterium]